MIYTDFSDLFRYFGISENLDTALSFLKKCDLKTLVHGRNEVDEEKVYINRFDYETLPFAETFFEAHEEYADIHLLLSGEENIGVSEPGVLRETERDPETDFIGYEGEIESLCRMTPEKILIAFPGEAHMVKMQRSGPVKVEKAVVKVKF